MSGHADDPAGGPGRWAVLRDLAQTADVTATYHNPDYKNTWICQVKINMNLACDELYNGTGMVARQNSSGYWNCYQ